MTIAYDFAYGGGNDQADVPGFGYGGGIDDDNADEHETKEVAAKEGGLPFLVFRNGLLRCQLVLATKRQVYILLFL
jgi:hypothetical protein